MIQIKNKLLFLFIFSCFVAFSQSKRKIIYGKIVLGNYPLENIHVINKNTKKGAVSNSSGGFHIPVKVNDTLVFSSVQFNYKQKIIKKEDLNQFQLLISLTEKLNELSEVSVEKINVAKQLNLPNAGKKKMNKVERRLNAHSESPLSLIILTTLIGNAGGINSLYYVLSGNRKADKKLNELIKNDKISAQNKRVFKQLKTEFGTAFFTEKLKIPEKDVDFFLEKCQEKRIVELYLDNKKLEVLEILIQESSNFNN